MEKIFIVGCGDIGHRVALREQSTGNIVSALARSKATERKLRESGIIPVSGDLDDPGSLKGFDLSTNKVYYLAPPPSNGTVDTRIKAFLDSIPGSSLPSKIVLISTTGVYGDRKGEMVTEETPPVPQADRAKRRLSAEQSLLDWSGRNKVPVVILRVPGIYGPGRLPVERLRRGEPVLADDGSHYSNRIHADDLADVCIAAMRKGRSGEIYNVSDGAPSSMTDYFFQVADLLKIPRPPEISLDKAKKKLGAGMISYLVESKRIDNSKMLRELGIRLRYPNLMSGLPSCIDKKAKHWVSSR